jgi:hypothetical protein
VLVLRRALGGEAQAVRVGAEQVETFGKLLAKFNQLTHSLKAPGFKPSN